MYEELLSLMYFFDYEPIQVPNPTACHGHGHGPINSENSCPQSYAKKPQVAQNIVLLQ